MSALCWVMVAPGERRVMLRGVVTTTGQPVLLSPDDARELAHDMFLVAQMAEHRNLPTAKDMAPVEPLAACPRCGEKRGLLFSSQYDRLHKAHWADCRKCGALGHVDIPLVDEALARASRLP